MMVHARLLSLLVIAAACGGGLVACDSSDDGTDLVTDDSSSGDGPALDAGTTGSSGSDAGTSTDVAGGGDSPAGDAGSATPADSQPAGDPGQPTEDLPCAPQCDGKDCGADGCGGSCGACQGPCVAGECVCEPSCDDVECGGDGCGGTCGACAPGSACADGTCVCIPDCAGAECGDDGCGGTCGSCGAGLGCQGGACQPTTWTAVLIQDLWSGDCSSFNASGADITAASLFGPDGALISHFTEVIGSLGTDECNNNYTSIDSVTGDPGSNNSYVALQGGWVLGTFGGQAILPGFTVAVYEFGSGQGGTDENYQVYLATDLDCPSQPDPAGCVKLLTEAGSGNSEVQVP